MAVGIGIELGPSVIRAARLERSGGAITLLAAEEVACDPSHPETLRRALIHLRQTLRITQPVVLGVPGTSAILTTVNPLVVNPKRAILAVQFELQQQLPFELKEAVWHYHWLSTNGQTVGSRLKALGSRQVPSTFSLQPRAAIVAAIKRSLLDERLTACRRAGLGVRAVAINAVAMLNACHLQQSSLGSPVRSKTMMLLHLVSDQAGEWLLWTPDRLEVMSVSSPSPEAFRQELTASWQAMQAEQPELPASVSVLGSSAARAGIQEVLATTLRLRVEPFDPSRVVTTGAVSRELAERAVAALGLALQGLGLARVPLNLLAGAQREETSTQIRRAAAVTAGLCALAALGLGSSGMWDIRQRRLRVLDALTTRERLYQTLRPDVRALLQRQQRLDRLSRQLERLIGETPLLTQVFAQVADALPDQVWLTKTEYSKTDSSVDGVIEGRAPSFQDVTQLLERLKSLAGMTNVKPLSTSIIADSLSGKELVAFAVQVEQKAKP